MHARAVYLASPSGVEIGGLGTAWRADADGPDRFSRLRAALREEPGLPERPFVFGAAFGDTIPSRDWSGFPVATIQLPTVAVVSEPQGRTLAVTVAPGRPHEGVLRMLGTLADRPSGSAIRSVVEKGDDPPDWDGLVSEALARIEAGRLEKVVLALRRRLAVAPPLEPFAFVDDLRAAASAGTVWAWQEGPVGFVGASPELLVASDGSMIRSHPLAGSVGRGAGDEDDRLSRRLIGDPKQLAEHEVVVRDLIEGLRPLVGELRRSRPHVERLPGIQHLGSWIEGELRRPAHLLELVEAVHPSGAVAGAPTEEAMELIAGEGFDRGWYGGVVGWCDSRGRGEAAVAIRCALIRGSEVGLFAGAGIVSGSRPATEHDELELKMAPLLESIRGTV